MNLKEILNAVLGESGFLEKPAFAGSADVDDKQMVSIANRMAKTILEFYNWSSLRKSHTVTMEEGKNLYDLPADFSNMVPDSIWEVDGSRRVELPTPSGRWYMYKFSAYSDGGTLRARIMGNQIEVHDVQPGESFSFEYVSDYPVRASDNSPKEYFTQDDDEFVLDDEVLIKGIQWKWGHAKMMPQYQEWRMDFNKDMNAAIGRDSGGRTIGGSSNDTSFIESRQPYYPLYRR